jgi:hypothetical protein
VGIRERADRALASCASRAGVFGRAVRGRAEWLAYAVTALVCAAYMDSRANFIPKWGDWYDDGAAEAQPYVYLQVRAWLSGRWSLVLHPAGAGNDYVWGRNGMHTVWGLGVPLLAAPFHLVGLLFGAPGFPDRARFLIFYAATTFVLARALHATSRKEANALVASCAAAGFVMTFPTFIGLLCARFLIYEQTICTGALWSVLLLAGVLAILRRCTPARLALVWGAAAFATVLRPTLTCYGLTTVVLTLVIAHRRGLRPLGFVPALAAAGAVSAFYLVGNAMRFGSPFNGGYANCISLPSVNRLLRWGVSFAKVPFKIAAEEMYATTFRLEAVPGQVFNPPPSVAPYVMGERWREYYSPGYDRLVLAGLFAALAIVCWRFFRYRFWRRDIDLAGERAAIVGAWALPPAIALFVFYARAGNLVTRYLVDMFPAFTAALLCVGMTLVEWFRKRAPRLAPSAQLALAGGVALYNAGWTGWATGLSHPVDRKAFVAKVAEIDALAVVTPAVPKHFRCNEPRGPRPVHMHLDFWGADCGFASGMVFAMPHAHCVAFTLRPQSGKWGPAEDESLASFRAIADFDPLVSCGAPTVEGDARIVTLCDPHPPAFLLDGMRLYSIATLDEGLNPIDRLKLMQIDGSTSCR